ncbi:pyroglutamyl-peptidase 1 [Schistocerca nitens]|uniref:pyroglutamyl-peptidase 1 n=1 Tax=Schistocerca nitens TaxID=7011 RepID=UPI002117AD18|nr:pyroglutamyl-peptidase 1 [Schistocerca nitens]XP_049816856.1 pyroglutamyl-peptidase 1 [Schistocerca nitens]XP_049816857.1 pyroglutamyl-peptidase 1 [Schistocerca nitens]XP_049816858.1 pyroglutamyl-peptidase 1 [Schistocerca nitens]XP_049816859.1 pyroglutamyl-peptidase 1 [Schistocerca nitens]
MPGTIEECVVVTGFGPFQGHDINASWEAVKLLPELESEEQLGVKLIVMKLPVAYEDVVKMIPAIWTEHKPMLVIHVGVSGLADKITLEKVAHRSGYKKADIFGQLPAEGECCLGCSDEACSSLDVEQICCKLNESECGLTSSVSSNAGRYLCEFTYYSSLSIDDSRTLFIHVPDLNKPYSALELARGIKQIISIILNDIRGTDQTTNHP